MSTQHLQTQTERQPDRTTTRATPAETTTPTTDPRTATDRAPQTFSNQNRARLENLIDEFNTAFAGGS
ncbi:hypothetical protein [Natronorubrum texcoconense]|uniref:Uncharacterized protein n=1 Tax=Natronorubrum texcoconense TaxID=1095776 RepID=A0A1G8TCG7_9EURY|nr:hypothetical protein [Natronorubrum texcoconense]SDJ39198.1 hypothetical protein SAMN04515672_0412 [Natronorubrum texcoconense]